MVYKTEADHGDRLGYKGQVLPTKTQRGSYSLLPGHLSIRTISTTVFYFLLFSAIWQERKDSLSRKASAANQAK